MWPKEVEFSKLNFILPEVKYEYLGVRPDVELHAWGSTLAEAFEQCGLGIFAYMTDLDDITVEKCYQIKAKDDENIVGMLMEFLNELFYLFEYEPHLMCLKIEITKFDVENLEIECRCYGQPFGYNARPLDARVRKILHKGVYSEMQIIQQPEENYFRVVVPVDI